MTDEDDRSDDPIQYVHEAPDRTVDADEFIERFGETELELLTPDPLKYSATEHLVSLPFDEVRLRVEGADKSGIAHLNVYDGSYSNPMKEDYFVTDGAEIIITIDGGNLVVVEDD